MQTYTTKRKNPDRAVPAPQEAAPSRSEMLHLSGAGAPQPMSPQLREKFEPGFGADFSNIRISRGHIPEELGVQAVAQGTDILLDESAGMDVLGHELAHVVQQAQGRVAGGYPVVENAALEHEADVMGERVSSGLTAQAGPQNGFGGGEMLSISPMSSASAPAQCKSRQEKKDQKTMNQISAAEQKRDAALAAAPQSQAREIRKAFGHEMQGIVNKMSDRQLHDPKMQQRMVSMASSAVNADVMKTYAADTGNTRAETYADSLRGVENEPEMAGMNTMMYRLMGGAEYYRGRVKAPGTAEERLSTMVDDLAGNADVTRMLTQFRQGSFQGVDRGAMADPELQSIAVMNNFFTRNTMRAGVEGAEVGKNDKQAMAKGGEVSKLLATDPNTGALARDSAAARRAATLLNPSAPAPSSSQLFQQQMAHIRAQGTGGEQSTVSGTPGQLSGPALQWVQNSLFTPAPAASGGPPIGVQVPLPLDLPEAPGVGETDAPDDDWVGTQGGRPSGQYSGSPDDHIRYDMSAEEEGQMLSQASRYYLTQDELDEMKAGKKKRRR